MPAQPYRATSAISLDLPGGATIIAGKHHGRSLEILGHAADYLEAEAAEDYLSSCEAVHILKCLGREVFDDYAVSRLHHAA